MLYVLHSMLMGCPNQTGSLQGHPRGSKGGLAGNDPGTGLGWQQSRQNWTLLAVAGKQFRVACNDLCSKEMV